VIDQNPAVPCAFTRRAFCLQACEAVSLAALGSMLQACSGSPTSPSSTAPALTTLGGTVANGFVTVTIDPAGPLGSVGGAVLVQTSSAAFLVARTAQSTFTALTAICTHEGCTITGFQSPDYVCPCHGSQYTTAGGVVMGPATQPLRQFSTQFANPILTIAT
jgi:cytochrome b6-f complex iron-sulfur subunit